MDLDVSSNMKGPVEGPGDHDAMKDHAGTTGMGGMMMMQMFFEVSYKATILFEKWKTTNATQMWAAVAGLVVAGILYEAIKFYKELLRQRLVRSDYLAADSEQSLWSEIRRNCFSFPHVLLTVLHFVQITLSYLLMLVAMTFNVWLFLAIVVGSTIGYFIFGWKHASLSEADHCG